jgi:GNAT superfamily N-acetyltransferase
METVIHDHIKETTVIIERISNDEDVIAAATLSHAEHARLFALNPWLPPRTRDDYEARIGWMVREGAVFALREGAEIRAFLGGFTLENFRNEGPGSLSPDWCMGFSDGIDSSRAARELIRAVLSHADGEGLTIHAAGVLDSRREVREAFFLSGYGAIVLDLAKATADLARDLESRGACRWGSSVTVRRADSGDAERLASLDAQLAGHIRAAPPLMPGAHGSDAGEWREWLAKEEARAFVALEGDSLVGFMKAEDPQFDVSYAVHGPSTFAIDGLFVDPASRGRGVARELLRSIVREASERGKTVTSVDCETMNPEAYAFWTRWFTPLSWSLERRWGAI